MYTEKALEANAKLKQEISRLKTDMRSADDTAPASLEEIVIRNEAELKGLRDEETAILKECIDLCNEWDQCKFRRAEINAATEELNSVFNTELEEARKAKAKLSRNNEYFNN